MLKKLAVRAAAVLLAVTPLAGLPAPAVADTGTGTLFGISGNQDKLDVVDPTAGTLTQLTDLTVAGADAQTAGMAGDPIAHRIFAIRLVVTFTSTGINFETQLLTINSVNGAILSKPDVAGRPLQSLAFDPTTDTLYAFNGVQVLRVNPSTGALAPLATIPNAQFSSGVFSMAIAPARHTIYVADDEEFGPDGNPFTQITAVDTRTGIATVGPQLSQMVRSIVFDEGSGTLDGVTDCCPFEAVSIDLSSGTVNLLATIGDSSTIQPFWLTAVPALSSFVLDDAVFDPSTGVETDTLITVNDRTGASTPGAPLSQPLATLLFQPSVTVTPNTPSDDINAALASGQITKTGVANTLLSDLNAALAARNRGQCKTAASIYQQFIVDVAAQTGKSIAVATASRLTSEAEYLQANCP